MCCQYFSRYFSRANAVWEQVDVRPPGALSLSAFCSKNLIEKRARPRSSRWEENKHLMMYQGPGCVSTWDIIIFKNILKAKLTKFGKSYHDLIRLGFKERINPLTPWYISMIFYINCTTALNVSYTSWLLSQSPGIKSITRATLLQRPR